MSLTVKIANFFANFILRIYHKRSRRSSRDARASRRRVRFPHPPLSRTCGNLDSLLAVPEILIENSYQEMKNKEGGRIFGRPTAAHLHLHCAFDVAIVYLIILGADNFSILVGKI